jgi:hypothetical protein
MTPLLADAINIPMVLVGGIIVLIPLMAFEVFVEAFVLKKSWSLPYGQLCTFAFFANLWSLLAGIPTKILNAFVYSQLLPQDIPGFFGRYPFAIAVGSLIYFAVTVLVEGAYALRWRARMQLGLSTAQVWRGILLANVATYVVLAPVNYYATKPGNQIQEFTQNTHWASHSSEIVLFVDTTSNVLKSVHLDGSGLATVSPFPTTDYLVSSNLSLCLFRGTNGNLYFYRSGTPEPYLIWQTDERFLMKQVAFSPSGRLIAYASKKQNAVELLEVSNGKRTHVPLVPKFDFDDPLVVWSPDEERFYVSGLENRLRLAMSVQPDGTVDTKPIEGTNSPPILICYGRIGTGGWWGGDDWGASYSHDECGDLKAMAWPGLDSGLYISRKSGNKPSRILSVSVRPGLLHLAGFYFGDVAFVGDCRECLFEANGYIYLLDIEQKRLGTLVRGDRFIQLTPRYQQGS